MTTTADRTTQTLPWHAQPGLSWRPRTGGLVLCPGTGGPSCPCCADGVAAVATVPAPPPGFENLCGVDALLDALLPPLRERAPQVADAHRHVVDLVLSSRRSEQIGRLVPISEAAALGTTRRVSRESHTAALWIDEAARFVAAAVAALSDRDGPVWLQVESLDGWDRPSLRVLHRAVVLGDGPRPLWVHGTLHRWAPPADPDRPPAGGVLDELRTGFLAALAARPTTVTVPGGPPARTGGPDPAGAVAGTVEQALREDGQTLLRLVGDALALQNFERVQLLVDAGFAAVTDAALTTHLHRLAAISRAQVGAIDAALDQLERAIAGSSAPEVTAHLHYLRGLITTKRHYDLDAATAHYEAAMRVLAGLDSPSPDALVEQAWTHNGLGLAAAMRARGATGDAERRRHFDAAFAHEFTAFRLVRGLPGMSAFYLRYNLGYNLSFLLEITGRYREAQDFLASVSSVLLAANRADFGALYKYAIGILELKAGDTRAAAATLHEAVELAHSLRDPFYLERMLAAVAYAAHRRGDHADALAAYTEGARIARWLRDPESYRQQLAGALWSVALGGLDCPPDVLAACADWYPQVADALRRGGPGAAAAALEEAGAVIPVPSSKLPSYIPTVDLEGTPRRDLNRYLAGVATTEAPTAGPGPLGGSR